MGRQTVMNLRLWKWGGGLTAVTLDRDGGVSQRGRRRRRMAVGRGMAMATVTAVEGCGMDGGGSDGSGVWRR